MATSFQAVDGRRGRRRARKKDRKKKGGNVAWRSGAGKAALWNAGMDGVETGESDGSISINEQ